MVPVCARSAWSCLREGPVLAAARFRASRRGSAVLCAGAERRSLRQSAVRLGAPRLRWGAVWLGLLTMGLAAVRTAPPLPSERPARGGVSRSCSCPRRRRGLSLPLVTVRTSAGWCVAGRGVRLRRAVRRARAGWRCAWRASPVLPRVALGIVGGVRSGRGRVLCRGVRRSFRLGRRWVCGGALRVPLDVRCAELRRSAEVRVLVATLARWVRRPGVVAPRCCVRGGAGPDVRWLARAWLCCAIPGWWTTGTTGSCRAGAVGCLRRQSGGAVWREFRALGLGSSLRRGVARFQCRWCRCACRALLA